MIARFLVALLLLVQPLPALGLQVLLPCASGCEHCSPAGPADDACGCSEPDEAADSSCPCVHEAPSPQPAAPAPTPESSVGGDLSSMPCAGWAWTDCRVPDADQSALEGLGHDPPPSLSVLCVWRN